MKKFFQALAAQLLTVSDLQHVRMWNNQHLWVIEGKMELFGNPSAFIEFESGNIDQMGEGIQIYNPLTFKVHLLDWQMDAGDGTFEQNLAIYDLKDKVFQALQKFNPGKTDSSDPASICIRVAEEQDYEHKGLYHFIQTYKATLVDVIMQEPVNGIDSDPVPMPLEIDQTTVNSQDNTEPHVFTFTPAP